MNVVRVQDATGVKTKRLLFIQRTLEKSLRTLNVEHVIVDVTLIPDRMMKALNRKYRGKNKSTDVLSFSQKDMTIKDKKVLGDIFIAKETARKQAKQLGFKLQYEYAFLAVHGLLHLLGYDHEKQKDEMKMFGLQEKLLAHV